MRLAAARNSLTLRKGGGFKLGFKKGGEVYKERSQAGSAKNEMC